MLSHFKHSIIFTVCCLILWGVAGYMSGGTVTAALSTMFIVFVLGVLETSLSFDNAVINVTVLKKMDAVWRKRFLTWWILIAVVGMRIVFPLLIVAIFGHISPWQAIHLALFDAAQYGEILKSSHIAISGFGWAFLLMVGCKFFFDKEKEIHWIHHIERWLTKLGKIQAVEAALVLVILALVSRFLPVAEGYDFFVSGVWGVVLYIVMDGFSELLGAGKTASVVSQNSAVLFVYLELLDASFSLDGVIGAFALSTNLIVIALGLGIGAYFVRSITMYLFDKGTLGTYRYLEHGAFYAIIALAVMMMVGAYVHIPEVITGLIGAVFIWLSIFSSHRSGLWDRTH